MITRVGRDTAFASAEEEPPGTGSITRSPDTWPMGISASAGESLFGNTCRVDWEDWKWHFRHRVTTVDELAKHIPLSPREQTRLRLVTRKYPLAITPYYLSLISPHHPEDPVRKQAVPSIQEVTRGQIGSEDPLAERRDSVVPGLVHRYPDRVLMVLTDICPMYCRHCTRKREWRRGSWVRTPAEVAAMLDYLRAHEEVRDVILSGGDPLTLSTGRLERVISAVRSIRHVEIIRIGSRCPVVLPQRIDDELCGMLSRYGPIWLNTHFNHWREITPEAAAACDRLVRSGIPVNNQSVLLRGVNDTLKDQMKLCHGLLRIKVRPYYLFQCDEVQGTEHLRTPVEVGIRIIEGMRGHTSGLAVPTFVVDLPDGGGKVPLQPSYVLSQTEEQLLLRNYRGDVFKYRNPGAAVPEERAVPGVSRLRRATATVPVTRRAPRQAKRSE